MGVGYFWLHIRMNSTQLLVPGKFVTLLISQHQPQGNCANVHRMHYGIMCSVRILVLLISVAITL